MGVWPKLWCLARNSPSLRAPGEGGERDGPQTHLRGAAAHERREGFRLPWRPHTRSALRIGNKKGAQVRRDGHAVDLALEEQSADQLACIEGQCADQKPNGQTERGADCGTTRLHSGRSCNACVRRTCHRVPQARILVLVTGGHNIIVSEAN
eukprot:7378787-Prymnesium_polylepis.3